jgi:hypothetical protein
MPCERVWVVLRVLVAGLSDKGLSFAVIAVAIIVIASVIIMIAGAITAGEGVVLAPDQARQSRQDLRDAHANARVSALSRPVLKPAAAAAAAN